MSIDSKTRMVSFRLTSEEYEQFRDLCFSHGISSISEMARTALHWMLQQPKPLRQETMEARIAQVEGRIDVLAYEVKQLRGKARTADAGA